MYDDVKFKIANLEKKAEDIQAMAESENRSMLDSERDLYKELLATAQELKLELPVNGPLTLMDGPLTGGLNLGPTRGGYELRGPMEAKAYRNLFAGDGYQWPDRETSFFQAVFSGRHHPGLTIRALNETTPSDGGFLVPVETASKIHNVSLENEIALPRCFLQPMRSNTIKIPAMVIGSHASSLLGGFTASYVAEAGTIAEKDPKARAMELQAKKLTGLIRFSAELTADVPGGESQIVQICGKGLAWYRDKAFLKGTGASEPLGILNSPCLVEVAKEPGQRKETIVYENLVKMMGRMYPGSFKNSCWVCHQSTIPQLLTLSLAVGTGGNAIPVMSETDGRFTMLTRPVVFTEKTETLGAKGDILLADFSQYVVGLRSEMRFDVSIHVAFETDELLARLVERHDGQPLWDEPLTLADGKTTVSPFVVLAERA